MLKFEWFELVYGKEYKDTLGFLVLGTTIEPHLKRISDRVL